MSNSVSPRVHALSVRVTLCVLALGATVVGIVSMSDRAATVHAELPPTTVERSPAAISSPATSVALAPAVRLNPPAQVEAPVVQATTTEPVPSTAAPRVDRSTCRNDLHGAVMTLIIPAISYTCSVYAGGQSTLDSGAVTQITDEAIRRVLADHPGGPGLLWFAGHRTTHGAAFADVPNLADGALVIVSDGSSTATYRVVGRLYVTIINDRVVDASGVGTGAATLDSIIRPDHGGNGASRLLLQTCDGANHRWMIYADLVTI